MGWQKRNGDKQRHRKNFKRKAGKFPLREVKIKQRVRDYETKEDWN